MNYINGGVEGLSTKKALKDAVKADPSKVYFYGTSAMGPQFNGPVTDMPDGAVLQVCGPDPYRKRSWYASVKKAGNGFTVA